MPDVSSGVPKISEERRVVVALGVLLGVGVLSVYLAFAQQARIKADMPVEGPPSPTCNALTSFNFADLLALRLATTPGFSPSDPKAAERIEKLSAARSQLLKDAPDYEEQSAVRSTYMEHLLRGEAVSNEENQAASDASKELVEAQRKKCPVAKPGTTTTKPPGSTTTTVAQ
jgi:hypothetical protein